MKIIFTKKKIISIDLKRNWFFVCFFLDDILFVFCFCFCFFISLVLPLFAPFLLGGEDEIFRRERNFSEEEIFVLSSFF